MKKTNKTALSRAGTRLEKAASAQSSIAPRTETVAAAKAQPKVTRAAEPRNPAVSLEIVKPEAAQVFVAGTFNQWRPETTPLERRESGRWVKALSLPPGRHEYLFVVDGQWIPDPNAAESVQNPFGGRNSVLSISA